MTVASTSHTAHFYGNGTAGPFTFGFRFLENSSIVVTKKGVDGTAYQQVEGVSYTLTGAGSYVGGSIELNVPLLDGEELFIERLVAPYQLLDLRNQGGAFPELVETAFDRLTMVLQPLNDWMMGSYTPEFLVPANWKIPGTVADGIADDTAAIQAYVYSRPGGVIYFGANRYRITGKIRFGDTGTRGSYILQGAGGTAHLSADPLVSKGTVLIWDGNPGDVMLEFGSDSPLYIAGVLQSFDQAQFNNHICDMSIVFRTGIKAMVYAHDQDGFQVSRLYLDAYNNTAVRGLFDFRGAVNNIRFQQVTMFNCPNAYGVRLGDGSTNCRFDQVFVEGVGLGYWIGDTATYEEPYQNGIITIQDGTFEGLSGIGKFSVDTLAANALSTDMSIVVADGTKFAANDPVYIDRGENKFEMNRVGTVIGNTLVLAYPLEYGHASGAIIKAGRIGVHVGNSSLSNGRTTTININRCMWDRFGCGIDAHHVDVLNIDMPTFASNMQRGLYLDGDTQNITLKNPRVFNGQLSSWRLFEITSRGNVYNFSWWAGADRSGVSQPYINSQGEIDGFYIGSFSQTGGVSDYPSYFRGITFDGAQGVVIRETDNALGLRYITGPGAGNTNFEVTPGGDVKGVTMNTRWGTICTTPDGTKRYRINVDDGGNITSTLVT